MKRWIACVLWAVVLGAAACGGDDGGNGEMAGGSSEMAGGSSSFTAIAESLATPTGTVDAVTAPDIALEFEKISSREVEAKSRQKQAQAQEMPCEAGGVIRYQGQGDADGVRSAFDYDNCCYEGGCCLNGSGEWYFATQSAAAYSYCGEYDLVTSCSGAAVAHRTQYEGCVGADGAWVYVVRVNGESFAVTGTYRNGNGTLEVRGENGSFTCTYSNGSGSCAGTGQSFTF